MFWRIWQVQIFFIFVFFEVEVFYMGVSEGVSVIKIDIFQGRSDKFEIMLVREFYIYQIGIICIFGLDKVVVQVVVVFVVCRYLVDNEIVYFFIEYFCVDQIDIFEIIICIQVEVIRKSRFQVGIIYCYFVI